MKSTGVKHDQGKPRVDLLPPKALLEVGVVLGHGAAVYGDDNWRSLFHAKRRYVAAALRHLFKFMGGQVFDEDSGRHHLAHAATCLLFVLELELEGTDAGNPCGHDGEGGAAAGAPSDNQ